MAEDMTKYCKNCYECQVNYGGSRTDSPQNAKEICEKCYECQVGYGGSGNAEKPQPVLGKFNHLTIWVTTRCSSACRYCFVFQRPENQPGTDLDDKVIEALPLFIDKYCAPKPSIFLFGGEPFVAFDKIQKIHAAVKDKIGKMGVTSNCINITDEMAKWCADNDIGILCSLDGTLDSAKMRVYRDGSPTQPDAMKGLSNVRLHSAQEPEIRCTVSPENVQYMFESFKYFVGLGLDKIATEYVYEVDWSPEALNTLKEQIRLITQFLFDHPKKDINVKTVRDAVMAMFKANPSEKWKNRCGLAQGGVGVDVDGALFYCHRFVATHDKKFTVGNILTGVDEAARKKTNDDFAAGGKPLSDNPERCKTCLFLKSCIGCCLGVNADTTGSLNKVPKAYCDIMTVILEVMAPLMYNMPEEVKTRHLGEKMGVSQKASVSVNQPVQNQVKMQVPQQKQKCNNPNCKIHANKGVR